VPATRRIRRDPVRAGTKPLPRRQRGAARNAPRWSATGALLAAAAAAAVALIQPLAPTVAPRPEVDVQSVVASLDADVQRTLAGLQDVAGPPTRHADLGPVREHLHEQLRQLVPLAAKDPTAALRVVDVLRQERALLAEHAPAELPAFEAEAAELVAALRASAPEQIRAMLPLPSAFQSVTSEAVDALPNVPQPSDVGAHTTTPTGAGGGTADDPTGGSGGSGGAAADTTAGGADVSGASGSTATGDGSSDVQAPEPAPAVTVPALPIQPPSVPLPDPGPEPSSEPAPATGGSSGGDTSPDSVVPDLSGPQLPAPPVVPDPATT
jgi:hypothetical protein